MLAEAKQWRCTGTALKEQELPNPGLLPMFILLSTWKTFARVAKPHIPDIIDRALPSDGVSGLF